MQTTLRGAPVLSTGNRFRFAIDLERPNTTTGSTEDATGLTVVGHLALTKGGTAITDPVTTVTLTEYGTSGRYAGELAGSVADAVLALNAPQCWACYSIASETLEVWARVTIERERMAA